MYRPISRIGSCTTQGDEIINAAAFYLYPGFVEQARVLADEAFKEVSADKVRVRTRGLPTAFRRTR